MICAEVRESLAAMLDGELAGTADLQAHLAACEACRRELAGIRAARRVVERVLSVGPQVDLASGFTALLVRVEDAGSASAARPAGLVASSGGRPRGGAGRSTPLPRTRPARAGGSADRARRGRAGRAAGWLAARRVAVGGGLAALGLLLAVARFTGVGVPGSGEVRTSRSPASAGQTTATEGGVAARMGAGGSRPAERLAARGADEGSGEGREADELPARGAGLETVGLEREPAAPDRDLDVPDEVRRQPGLFLDLPIVKRLEKLRRLEAVYHQEDAAAGGAG